MKPNGARHAAKQKRHHFNLTLGVSWSLRAWLPQAQASAGMGGTISGAAYPAVADRVVSATVGPYVASLVLGGHWGVAFVGFAMYHFLFTATNGWSPPVDDPLARGAPYTNFQATTGLALTYYITLPALALVFALLGWLHGQLALSPGVFPHHAWPLSHLVETRPEKRPKDDSVKGLAGGLTAAYVVTLGVMGVLAAAGSWLPYEMLVRFLDADSVWIVIVGTCAPTVAVLVLIGVPWLACGPAAHVFRKARGKGTLDWAAWAKAWGAAAGLPAGVAVPVALVAWYTRDADWTWMTAAIAGALYLVLGLAAIPFCGCHSREGEEEEAEGEKTTLVQSRLKMPLAF